MASKLGPPRITRGQAKLHTDTDRDRILTAPGAVAYGLADLVLEGVEWLRLTALCRTQAESARRRRGRPESGAGGTSRVQFA
jgi:hypothetical protein